jgi:hypothetical protein
MKTTVTENNDRPRHKVLPIIFQTTTPAFRHIKKTCIPVNKRDMLAIETTVSANY